MSEKHEKCIIQEGRIGIHGMVPTKMASSTTSSNCYTHTHTHRYIHIIFKSQNHWRM